jgi:hypothetical protein
MWAKETQQPSTLLTKLLVNLQTNKAVAVSQGGGGGERGEDQVFKPDEPFFSFFLFYIVCCIMSPFLFLWGKKYFAGIGMNTL